MQRRLQRIEDRISDARVDADLPENFIGHNSAPARIKAYEAEAILLAERMRDLIDTEA